MSLPTGRFNNASDRAYNAAIIALLRAGLASRNNRWDHDEVAARFAGELIGRRKLYASSLKTSTTRLQEHSIPGRLWGRHYFRRPSRTNRPKCGEIRICDNGQVMVVSTLKPVEHYVNKITRHLLRKYPSLTFNVVKERDDLVFIYYSPQDDELDYDIIHRSSGIAIDALVDAGYRIWVMPA